MLAQDKSFYADLYSKTVPAKPLPSPPPLAARKENLPVLVKNPRQIEAPKPTGYSKLSPRQMVTLSLDLYIAGALSFEDYAELAFQPELHPDFNATIGALTGEKAEPDRPRDFVRLWQDKAEFQRRHNNERQDLIEQSERIAEVLSKIKSPANVLI